jgi:PAS domain S-box-containing protein
VPSGARRLLGAPLAAAIVTLLFLVDLGTGPDTVLSGLMVIGPALAAVASRPRAVLAVGGYTVAVMLAVAGPDDLWAESELGYFLAAAVLVTVVSAYSAHLRQELVVDAAQLAAIVESSADAIVGKALDGTISSWNAAAERIYGWPAGEVVGRNIRLIVPDDRVEELDDMMRRAGGGEVVPHYLTQRVTKGGRRVDVSLSAAPIRRGDGAVVGVSALAREVTEALAAAVAVQESEARKSAILAGALDAIVTIDHTGRVIEVNEAMSTTFGWTAAELVGRELAETIVPEEKRAAHREGIAAYLRSGGSPLIGARLALTAVRKDGSRIPVEVTITRVDLPGDPVFTGYLRDMSAHAAAEEEADRLRDRLRQADRLDALGQLAGGVAHDFNNLLAVILNYAALVRDELPAGAVRDDVDAISAAAQRAADLTRQLLTFSSGDRQVKAVADPNAVAAQVCDVLRRTMPATISVVSRLAPDAWPVLCDTTRLDQVLMNLAVNARDAMPGGGTLTVETSNEHLDELAASSRVTLRPGRYLRLTVSDTGTGMSREVQERAFDPFFTTKPQGKGTGLGLATVYGIARQMGGEVSIYSEPGHGTSVRLHLPVADDGSLDTVAATASAPEVAGGATVHGRRVLLVEDEALLRHALERTLAGAGFEVQVAQSAEDALAGLGGLDGPDGLAGRGFVMPDLLISDVTLPGMTGPELAVRLRELDPTLPVLLMSGYAAHQLPDRLDGNAAMIDKPFPVRALLGRVGDLLGDGPAAP